MAPQTLKQIRAKQRANRKAYHARMKDDPEYRRKQAENFARWAEKNRKKKDVS